MHYVTRVSSRERFEKPAQLKKYEILSIVVRRILGILEVKIRNTNENLRLRLEEPILLCHRVSLCQSLALQTSAIDWTKRGVARTRAAD